MFGFDIPENDATWEILMLSKDMLELVTSFRFTDDTIDFLGAKISEHRGLLLKVFPHFVLCSSSSSNKSFVRKFQKCHTNSGSPTSEIDSIPRGLVILF